jgi:A/G-specific adenine glycosylase
VLREWAGLGYYARARNLHACARQVVARHGGTFPDTEDALGALPGIGPYTAAAIAAIAFDRRAAVVDGNVERVMSRLFAVEEALPAAKATLRAHARALTPADRPGDYAQAVMDLGATICTPRKPSCVLCPWMTACRARATGEQERYPLKSPKPERPVRHGVAFWITRGDGAVLIRRRAERGLLGGMMEFPSTVWREEPWADPEAAAPFAPVPGERWRLLPAQVSHTFTHFHLELLVLAGRGAGEAADAIWVQPAELGRHALPTLMKKVARAVAAAT